MASKIKLESSFYISRFATTFVLLLSILALLGCRNFIGRAQSPDAQLLQRENRDNENYKYIGNHCSVRGLNYAKLEGVGLAIGLDGTGSEPRPSQQREYLVRELSTKIDLDEVNGLLASDNTELVWLRAYLPPGIRRGEKFDVEVKVLENSDASSIELGRITQTALRPMERLGRGVLKGHTLAGVKGPILVDALFESRQDQSNHLRGIIPGGGYAMDDRAISLVFKDESV